MTAAQGDLPLWLDHRGDTIILRWGELPAQWGAQRVEVYVKEHYTHAFPGGEAVAQLSPKAKGWRFIQRRSINLLGLDVRHPADLGRKDRWTPGEAYTLGLRVILPDPLTQQPTARQYHIPVFPFTLLANAPSPNEAEVAYAPHEIISQLPASAKAFIQHDSFVLANHPKTGAIRAKIASAYEREKTFRLALENGQHILYQKPPNRPPLLGDWSLFSVLSSLLIVAILLLPLAFFLVTGGQSYVFRKKLATVHTLKEQKAIINTVLARRHLAVPLFYALLRNRPPSRDDHSVLIDALYKKVRQKPLLSKKTLKKAVQQVFESGQIEQALAERAAKQGIRNYIHMTGDHNIILNDIQRSNIQINKGPERAP